MAKRKKKRKKPLKRADTRAKAYTLLHRYEDHLEAWLEDLETRLQSADAARRKVQLYRDKVSYYRERVKEFPEQPGDGRPLRTLDTG